MSLVTSVLSGANGDPATQTNTASSAAVQATAGSANIATSPASPGDTRSLDMNGSSASGLLYIRDNFALTSGFAFGFWLLIDTLPSANIQIRRLRNVSSGMLDLTLLATVTPGRMRFAEGVSANPIWTTSAALSTGVWYYINAYVTQNSATGTTRLAYYTWSGSALVLVEDSGTQTGKNTGASQYDNLVTGPKPLTTTITSRLHIGGTRYHDNAATGMLSLPTIAPTAPTANAGSDQSVTTSTVVTLDGTLSTTPTGTLTYLWTQTGGTAVTLSSATAAQPTFTAPSTATGLTFSLVVNNGTASSTPDTVAVTVSAPAVTLVTSVMSGADGDPATQTNTASSTAPSVTGGSAAISLFPASPGDTHNLDMIGSATSGLVFIRDSFTATPAIADAFWLRVDTLPSANIQIRRYRTGNTGQSDLTLLDDGRLRIAEATSGLPQFTTTTPLSTGIWYYIGRYTTQHPSAGTERLTYYTWNGGAFQLHEDSGTRTGLNTGSAPYDNIITGAKPVTTTITSKIRIGGTRWHDPAATGLIPLPDIPNPPIAGVGLDQTVEPFTTVQLDGSSSTGDEPLTYLWTLHANTSAIDPVLSDATAIKPTYTAPGDWFVGSTQTWRLTLNGVSFDDVVVTVLPATFGLIRAGGVVTALRAKLA